MKQVPCLFTLMCCLGLLFLNTTRGEAAKRDRHTVTGTYAVGDGSAHVDVQQLPHRRIRLYLWAGWKDHFGEVLGVFPLKKYTAVYKARSGGTLTFRFLTDRVQVVQKGRDLDCDFGANVNAGGVYRLRSRRIPRFHPLVGAG